MADERDIEGTPDEGAGDYTYDLVHEALVEGQDPEQATPAASPHPGRHDGTYVATATRDTGGDYGYDLAHDLPSAPDR